jgi:hypothetical protein
MLHRAGGSVGREPPALSLLTAVRLLVFPVSNRVNTFLLHGACQQTSNLLATSTWRVLLLEPLGVCLISLPSGLGTCQPGFLQVLFLSLGCHSRECAPRTLRCQALSLPPVPLPLLTFL